MTGTIREAVVNVNDCAPSFETVPQLSMITLQHNDKINPSLREGIACVPVKDEPTTSFDQRLQFIDNLYFFRTVSSTLPS